MWTLSNSALNLLMHKNAITVFKTSVDLLRRLDHFRAKCYMKIQRTRMVAMARHSMRPSSCPGSERVDWKCIALTTANNAYVQLLIREGPHGPRWFPSWTLDSPSVHQTPSSTWKLVTRLRPVTIVAQFSISVVGLRKPIGPNLQVRTIFRSKTPRPVSCENGQVPNRWFRSVERGSTARRTR